MERAFALGRTTSCSYVKNAFEICVKAVHLS
jgi:hypothetical protein